jgi:hypothetical protein
VDTKTGTPEEARRRSKPAEILQTKDETDFQTETSQDDL